MGRLTEQDEIGNNYEKMSEYAVILKEKYGIDLDVDKILEVEKENRENHPRMADRDYITAFLKERGFQEAAQCLEEYME